jgi:CO/xanthine dehydrogenase FAD-binding subunit
MRPSLAYHRPATVAEACALLAREPEAAVLAGGTDLLVHLRQPWRGRRPSAVVNVKRIPGLARIDVTPARIEIGALASLTALIEHPVIARDYPVLPFAARYMGSPGIRHLATVGGNLCNASPAADLPPVLLALDAEVEIAGPAGRRRLPLGELFRGPGRTVLEPGELLTRVDLPRRSGEWTVRYERLDVRRAMDIALAGVALALAREPDGARGVVTEARVALCAVAPTPARVPEAEVALVGTRLDPTAVARAVAACVLAARPIDDVRASAAYRREMVGALARRGLAALADDAIMGA